MEQIFSMIGWAIALIVFLFISLLLWSGTRSLLQKLFKPFKFKYKDIFLIGLTNILLKELGNLLFDKRK